MKLLDRFKAETPVLWKRVIILCHTINVTCGGIMLGEQAAILPTQLTQYLSWVVGGTALVWAFAGQKVKKPDDAKG
jgi:hypothetical protein